jgi:hypothetical protein
MSTCHRRCLLLLVAGALAIGGAGCQFMRQYTQQPLPRVLPPSPTLEQVVAVVNRNNSQIQSVTANRASISVTGYPSLTASMAFLRPRQFRLRANSLAGIEVDLGSNNELFWFWVKRSQPPAIYYCRHDQFDASRARQMMPFEPQWLIEALGVMEFDPALPHQLTSLPNDRLRIDTVRNTPQGPTTQVAILDGSQGWVLEQYLYDTQGRLTVRAIAGGHRRDPATALVMPASVQIDCPAARMSMRIDLGNVEIGTMPVRDATGDPSGLWTMPSIPGVPVVDIGAPNFQLPATATTRRPVIQAGWLR